MDLHAHYSLLAHLFDYPREGFATRVGQVQQFLDQHYPELAPDLQLFTNFTAQATILEMEELFTRSFDVQAVTTLDIGYVLFGDDYKRGELLTHLNREHQASGQDCGNELADHLPNILGLLSKLKDKELAQELVSEIVFPALSKMIAEFNPNRVDQRTKLYKKHYKTVIDTSENYETIYQQPLKVLFQIMKKDFELIEKESPKQTVDFLKSLEAEMDVEYEHAK